MSRISRLVPIPATGPLCAGGEPLLDQRRQITARNIVNAAPHRQHSPEVMACIQANFPNVTPLGQRARDRR